MDDLKMCQTYVVWHSPWAKLLAGIVFIAMIFSPSLRAEEIKIGGTGGALATMQILADAFRQTHPDLKITILPSLGSSGGIKAVLAGAIQVAVSSRELKPVESSKGATAVTLGRTPFVFVVPNKLQVNEITTSDLVNIYSGTKQSWPNGVNIRPVLRPVGDSDSEMIKNISPEVRAAKMQAEQRPGMLFAVTDQDSADNLEQIPGAFGTSTLAQIVTEKRAVKALRFNDVTPSAKSLADGSYPLSKPLIIVIGPATPPSAQQFVDYVRSEAGRAILGKVGYSPL